MFRRSDEVERAVLERQLRGVGDLEPDAPGQLGRQQASGLFDHRGRHVDPHDVGLGKPLRGEAGPPCPVPVPRSRILSGSTLEAVEGGGQRRKPLRPDHLVPAGREPVELRPQRTAEDPPQRRPGDDDAGHETREAAPDRLAAAVHAVDRGDLQLVARAHAEHLRRVPAVDREGDVPVGVLVEDDVPAPHLRERASRGGVVALEPDLDLQVGAGLDADLGEMVPG